LIKTKNLNYTKPLTVILLSIALFGLTIQPVFAPHIAVKYDKRNYAPGDNGRCTVEIQMAIEDPTKDRSPLRFTKITLIFSFQTYSWEGELTLNPDDSTQKTITIDFSIPQGTSNGEYPGNVRLTYLIQGKGGEWEGPYSFTYNAGNITVRSSIIPGFPWESILIGISLGITVLLSRRTKNYYLSNPTKHL
jgi:hypothetical protein